METKTFVSPKEGSALVLVGTIKGAFVLNSDASRERWEVSGPHYPGRVVYSMAYDGRSGRQRIWSSWTHFAFGTLLHSTEDFGRTWTNPESAPVKFPEATGQSLKQIWQIAAGSDQEPGKMYCGVEPAALFESNDAGQTWSFVQGLCTGRSGSPEAVVSVCTRSWWILRIPNDCTWRFPQAASIAPTMAENRGSRGIRDSAPSSSPTNIPSSDSACTKLPAILRARSGCSFKTTADCSAATTREIAGPRS